MGIVVGAGNTVHGQEGLVHFPFQCQGFFQSMDVVVPVHAGALMSWKTMRPPRLFWYSMNICACSRSSSDDFFEEVEHSFQCDVVAIEVVG